MHLVPVESVCYVIALMISYLFFMTEVIFASTPVIGKQLLSNLCKIGGRKRK